MSLFEFCFMVFVDGLLRPFCFCFCPFNLTSYFWTSLQDIQTKRRKECRKLDSGLWITLTPLSFLAVFGHTERSYPYPPKTLGFQSAPL